MDRQPDNLVKVFLPGPLSALLSQECTDLGPRIDCLDLKGVCLEGAGGHWVVGKAGASLEVAEGRQGWARERCGRPRS